MPLIFLLVFLFSIAIAPRAAFAEDVKLEQDSDGYYLIENTDDLAAFRDGVNDGTYTSSNARLTANIDLSEYGDWTPIANYSYYNQIQYTGTFDGGGHTISGLYVNTSSHYAGFFGYVGENGVVKNLTIAGGSVSSNGESVGGIAGYNVGTVKNCGYLKNADVNSGVNNAIGNNNGEELNVGSFSDKEELNNIVFKLTPLIDGEELDEDAIYTIDANGTMKISFDAWPGKFDYVYNNGYLDIQYSGDNLVSFEENDGTITVIGQGSTGGVAITVTATLYTYKFSSGSYDTGSVLDEPGSYTVNVELVAAETPGEEETSGEESGGDNDDDSGSTESGGASGGSGGGGCNAGTGALALLALIPLALRRKR